MTILFVPNDPEAKQAPAPRKIRPARKRRKGKTDFDFGTLPKMKAYAADTAEFRVWQCREAVMRALGMWETIAGPLVHWQGSPLRKKLRVDVDEGSDLNAYYDRASLGYYHYRSKVTKKTRYFAASVDVASHEAGHAFLDAIRPELWDSNFPEPNAFHEAFGDCVALLTSLADVRTRRQLLAQDPKLTKANFVETLIESLAYGLRDYDPKHNGAKPRHARNTYKWVLPSTLPDDGGPGVLINEIHSFGQVFVGCFYDVVRNLFADEKKQDQRALWECAKRAGKLLVRAAIKAPHTPRFYQAVGRAMTLEDEHLYRGNHHDAIQAAFRRHGILLGSVAAVAPRAVLKGGAPKLKRKGAAVERETLKDLRAHLGISPRAALRMRAFHLGGQPVAEAVHERPVPLKGLSPKLENAVALGTEPALIGETNKRAAVLGALPDSQATHNEVRSFVASLVRRGAIAYDGAAARKRKKGGRGAIAGPSATPTHMIVRVGGQAVLKRIRFSCGCAASR
jgi:hypothetical protein